MKLNALNSFTLFLTISLMATSILSSCAEEASSRILRKKLRKKFKKSTTKVFGLGLSKTGTTSMAKAMELLGFTALHTDRTFSPFIHHRGEPVSLAGHYDNVDSVWDIPTAVYYRELLEAYPDAKFVLTVRDSQEWFDSFKKFLEYRFYLAGCAFPERVQRMFERVYGSRVLGEDWITAYERHNRDVQAFFADRPDQLLTMNVGQPDAWEKLCSFLGVQTGLCNPSSPGKFPKTNTAAVHKITDRKCQAKLVQDIKIIEDRSDEKYAYVSPLCNPSKKDLSEGIRQLLVLQENIREFDQASDIIAMVQGSITATQQKLLTSSGLKVYKVKKIGKRVSHPAPHSNRFADNCYRAKFQVLQLTQYRKVIYIEPDLLLKQDIKHMFNWPGSTSFIGFDSPVHGGFAVMEPSHQAWADLRDLSTCNSFNTQTGWIEYGSFPHWRDPNRTSDWSFPRADSDVGLWFYYYQLLKNQLTVRSTVEQDKVLTDFTGMKKPFLYDPNDLGDLPEHYQHAVLHWFELWNRVRDRLEKHGGPHVTTT